MKSLDKTIKIIFIITAIALGVIIIIFTELLDACTIKLMGGVFLLEGVISALDLIKSKTKP